MKKIEFLFDPFLKKKSGVGFVKVCGVTIGTPETVVLGVSIGTSDTVVLGVSKGFGVSFGTPETVVSGV